MAARVSGATQAVCAMDSLTSVPMAHGRGMVGKGYCFLLCWPWPP
jgi:hypothetical protein